MTTVAEQSTAENAKNSEFYGENDLQIPFQPIGGHFSRATSKATCISLSECQLDELVSTRHAKKTKEVANWSVSTLIHKLCG